MLYNSLPMQCMASYRTADDATTSSEYLQ